MIPKLPTKIYHFLSAIGIALVCFSWNYMENKNAAFQTAFQIYEDSVDRYETEIVIFNHTSNSAKRKSETDKYLDSLALEDLLNSNDKKKIREVYNSMHPYEDLKAEFDSTRHVEENFFANAERIKIHINTLKQRMDTIAKQNKTYSKSSLITMFIGLVIFLQGMRLWIKADLEPTSKPRKDY